MPTDFLADRRAEAERVRGQLMRMSYQLAVVIAFALVVLVPLMSTARARRLRADVAQIVLCEARAARVGLKTRERRAKRFQSKHAAIQEARSNRRLWLTLTAGMANYLPPDTWLTTAVCGQDEDEIRVQMSGASWSIDRLPTLTAAWAEDENTRAVTLKSIRSVTIDNAPAVHFELAIRYGPDGADAAEKAP